VKPAELGFKRFPEVGEGRARWCAIQGSKVKVNSLGSDNRGQEESYRGGFIAELNVSNLIFTKAQSLRYRRTLAVELIYRVLLIEKRKLKDFQLMSA
jgi:hypothetical protein